jgi:nitrite reductase/ring-hydroxylating ferredoxin subunit
MAPPSDPKAPLGCSRRQFCLAAGAGLMALGLPACGGDPRVTTGPLDTPDNSQGADLAGADFAGVDFAGQSPDLSSVSSNCSGPVQAGPASAIAVNASKRFSGSSYDLFLCRDSGGLFTVDSACTHAGALLRQQGSGWYCPKHGARFAFDGTSPTPPAFVALANYAVCVDASGNVTIDPNTTVSPTTRA